MKHTKKKLTLDQVLDKTIAAIKEAKPELCIMGSWAAKYDCGTAFCVAGWMCAAMGKVDIHTTDINDTATKYLKARGVSDSNIRDLFFMNPDVSLGDFINLPPIKRKSIMLNVLKHFKKTGGVDWRKFLK